MNRRKEYFYTLLIILTTSLGSYAVWVYSFPGHFPSLKSFAADNSIVQPLPAQAATQNSATAPAKPRPAKAEPAPQLDFRQIDIPVLMYHKINPYRGGGLYRITPDEFDWQMQYLKDNGYHSIGLGDILDHYQKGKKLPDKPFVITMDDGYRDNYLYAWPILQKYGFTATLFVVTNTVCPEGYDNMMITWSQIKEMADAGITIGCHTLDHPCLTLVGPREAERQILDSKSVLEEQLNIKIEFFSYPYGEHNEVVERIVKECGFRAATTVNPEMVSSLEDPFTLNRIGIYSNLSHQGFIDKVTP